MCRKQAPTSLFLRPFAQEYNYHLGAVNTITFVDNGNRFVSTSDDKTIRVWEFGIPVQIKYIADPSMHSMPAVALNPKGTYMLCQSLDNQVWTVLACQYALPKNIKKRHSPWTLPWT